MKKLDVVINPSSKSNWEAVNLQYAENECHLDEKIRNGLIGIFEDKYKRPVDIIEYVINNFSQEEAVVVVAKFFENEFNDAQRKANKKCKKLRKKNGNPAEALKALSKLGELFKEMSASQNIIAARSREELLAKIKARMISRGIELDWDKLENLNTAEELDAELKRQVKEQGLDDIMGIISISRNKRNSEAESQNAEATTNENKAQSEAEAEAVNTEENR